MKKIALILGVIVMIMITRNGFSQSAQEGVVTYEIRINNHRMLPADQEARKAMIPEFRTFKEQLFFNPNESLCKPLIEDEDEADNGGGRGRRFQPRAQYYSNPGAQKVITQQEGRGKTYLISDSVKVSPWKFGTEIKKVQNYDCKQAFYINAQKQTVTAWFTDKLRPFLGPDRYNTLPGAVLAVDINNGERVLVATKIELRALKGDELKEPTKGEKITQAEFRKIMEEQNRNRRERGGNQ